MRDKMTIHCRECGGVDIREKNVAFANLPIVGWRIGEGRLPTPTDYNTDVCVDWQPENDVAPYVCGHCGTESLASQLVVKRG